MATDVLTDILWTEKYRPTTLAAMAMEEEQRKVLQAYIDAGEIPHLLLIGPAGSGKTTIARILIRALDCQVLTLNASKDRGIDVVREQIGGVATAQTGARWNIVFLDESDAMTSDAQTALRNQIESYADQTRFILTANYGYRIIGPIQSRCQILMCDRPPLKERWRILTEILKKEKVKADPQVVLSYAEKFPDLRQMLFAAQKGYLGKGVLEAAQAPGGIDGAAILSAIERKNWADVRKFAGSGDFSAGESLRALFHAIPDDHVHAGFLRHKVGRGVHETGFTPDPIVLFLAVAAECMEGLR